MPKKINKLSISELQKEADYCLALLKENPYSSHYFSRLYFVNKILNLKNDNR